mgnify:CR=1 FL=1
MKKDFVDPYIQSNGVLANKLGIDDESYLQKREAQITFIRATEFEKLPLPKKFDFEHLKTIHKHLFKDVYEWAGKNRQCDISKGGSHFCLKDNLDSFADYTFQQLNKDHKAMQLAPGAFKNKLPDKLAHHFAELNALHPFREGNGRAQKIFIGQLAKSHGLKIDWTKMSKDQLVNASKEAMTKEPKQLAMLIRDNSSPLKKSPPVRGIKV